MGVCRHPVLSSKGWRCHHRQPDKHVGTPRQTAGCPFSWGWKPGFANAGSVGGLCPLWGWRMNKTYAALAGISILGLAAAAHAGAPIPLSDWQMDAVTAGSATAIAALQTSAVGRNTAIRTIVGNIAAGRLNGSLAQSRTAVLATGAGDASVATGTFNQSAADGHGSGQVATASTAGSASGDTATVDSVGVTTAVSASGRSGRSSIGIAESLAHVTSFSASGRSH
jgi:hypothetical protein